MSTIYFLLRFFWMFYYFSDIFMFCGYFTYVFLKNLNFYVLLGELFMLMLYLIRIFCLFLGMINILHGLGLRFLALGHHTPFMVREIILSVSSKQKQL